MLTWKQSSCIWTQNTASTLCASSTMPRDAIACPSVVQHIYLSVSKSNKQRRQQPLMHLYSSFSSLFWFLPIPTPCSPIISLPFSQFPPHLSHPLSLSLVHSSVSLKRLLLETSKGSIKGNDWACISLFFSFYLSAFCSPENAWLPFAPWAKWGR